MSAMKKLYLVDVSSMFFRAFYAIRQLSNSKGMPTNAVYGFLSMIVKLQKDKNPDYMAFCFDRPEPSFRKDIYGEYKANRSEMPEELIPQIPYIKKLTEAMGIPQFEQAGYEADDFIGSLTNFGLKNNLEVVIVSGDKDFCQLINDHVFMYDTMKNTLTDRAAVIEKYGLPPEHFIDYLALTGDSSDNIPGVKGVGPKGAQKLIEQFKTIEGIYENLEDVKNPGLKLKLSESHEMAKLSKHLVTIVQDIKMDITLKDLERKEIHKADLDQLLSELEFHTFKKTLVGDGASAPAPEAGTTSASSGSTVIVPVPLEEKPATPSGPLKNFAAGIVNAAPAAPVPTNFKISNVDFSGVEAWLNKHKTFWLVDRERQCIFASGDEVVIYDGGEQQLAEFFDRSTDLSWKGFDLKAAWKQLGLKNRQTAVWDSFLAAYVDKAGAIEGFKETHLLYTQQNLPELPDAGNLYQAQLELEKILTEKLQATNMLQILKTIELPVIDILTAMETKGVLIDSEFLLKESKVLAEDIKKVEKKIHEDAGEDFNVASPKQLAVVLFEKLKLPAGKKTKTGYSTNSDVLEKLSEFPIAARVIEYRELAKLKSTYVDALPALADPKTGRVHTQYNQALTATGRLSSVNPNLQNIPIRTERGMRIRRAFVAAPGHTLVSGDYSQIELRILAHIAKDEGLKEAFAKDIDIHTKAASEIFEVPLDKVDDDLRRKAKAVNFGIAYGQGAHGLAEGLGISRGEAKVIIDKYFQAFQGIKNYMQNAVEFVKEHGYAETILGRRRYLPEIKGSNHMLRAFAERAAINAPIQGMSSDLVKLAMIEVSTEYRDQLILQVHDELIFELPDDKNLPTHMEKIKSMMENCMALDVPLKVNMSHGNDWSKL